MKRQSQAGFTHITALILLAFVVIIAGLTFANVAHIEKATQSKPLTKQSKLLACKTDQEGLEVCIRRPASDLTPTQTMKLTVVITNKSDKTITKQFGSTCTEPVLEINDESPLSGACGMAITQVSVGVGKSRVYTLDLDGAKLHVGKNKVVTSWAESTSAPLSFTGLAAKSSDRKKASTCNDSDDQPYCANIMVTLKEGTYTEGSTCRDLEKYFKNLTVHPQYKYCELGNIGVLSFVVPQDEAEQWLAKIKVIPQVSEAYIEKR